MAAAVKRLTNAFVVQTDGATGGQRVLLGLKKRGFGALKWNGFGGKIEPGETPLMAAQREFQEEAGVEMADPRLLGKVVYTYRGMPKELHVYVFRSTAIRAPQGSPTSSICKPIETEEMKPQWFSTTDVPFDSMWADDPYWFQHMCAGEPFFARFDFDSDMKTILQHRVELVSEVDADESTGFLKAVQS